MSYKIGDKFDIKRNDRSPCESGKKYKKCCLNRIGKPFELNNSTWLPYHEFVKNWINKRREINNEKSKSYNSRVEM